MEEKLTRKPLSSGQLAEIALDANFVPRLKPTERLVLAKYCKFADLQNRLCYPAQETIAAELEITRATVNAAVRGLVAKGWLKEKTLAKLTARESEWLVSKGYHGQAKIMQVLPSITVAPERQKKKTQSRKGEPVKNFDTLPVKNFDTLPVKNFDTLPVKNFDTNPTRVNPTRVNQTIKNTTNNLNLVRTTHDIPPVGGCKKQPPTAGAVQGDEGRNADAFLIPYMSLPPDKGLDMDLYYQAVARFLAVDTVEALSKEEQKEIERIYVDGFLGKARGRNARLQPIRNWLSYLYKSLLAACSTGKISRMPANNCRYRVA